MLRGLPAPCSHSALAGLLQYELTAQTAVQRNTLLDAPVSVRGCSCNDVCCRGLTFSPQSPLERGATHLRASDLPSGLPLSQGISQVDQPAEREATRVSPANGRARRCVPSLARRSSSFPAPLRWGLLYTKSRPLFQD